MAQFEPLPTARTIPDGACFSPSSGPDFMSSHKPSDFLMVAHCGPQICASLAHREERSCLQQWPIQADHDTKPGLVIAPIGKTNVLPTGGLLDTHSNDIGLLSIYAHQQIHFASTLKGQWQRSDVYLIQPY